MNKQKYNLNLAAFILGWKTYGFYVGEKDIVLSFQSERNQPTLNICYFCDISVMRVHVLHHNLLDNSLVQCHGKFQKAFHLNEGSF